MSGGHEDLKFASGPTEAADPAAVARDRRRAARAVASASVDAAECAELLEMLGLQASDGRSTGTERAA